MKFNINDVDSISKRENLFIHKPSNIIPRDVLKAVQKALPAQPWPSGNFFRVVEETGIDVEQVSGAIGLLIKKGVFNKQKDGIVYDNKGQIIAIREDK